MRTLTFSLSSLLFLTLFTGNLYALHTETVEYKQGDTVLEGYLAYDDAVQAKRPGVLVVHEWTGLGDYVKKRTEALAELGYIAFAADIYGKGVRPQNPKDAGEQASIYKNNRRLMRERALAGLQTLQAHPLTEPSKTAATGYCFGGMAVLELARSGAELNGVVSFHGGLGTPNPEDAKKIKGKVLVLHGADDPHSPAEEVQAFEEEMRAAGTDWQVVLYGGAVHAFTNPAAGNDNSKGAAYHASADRRSWEAMKSFLTEVFA